MEVHHDIAVVAIDHPLHVVLHLGVARHVRVEHRDRAVAAGQRIRIMLDVVGVHPGAERIAQPVLVVEHLDEPVGHFAHRQVLAVTGVERIRSRHQNIPLSFIARSGTAWITSQCSTILQFSTRKMSTTAEGCPLGSKRASLCTAARSPSTSTRWTMYRASGFASKNGCRKLIAASRPVCAIGLWLM